MELEDKNEKQPAAESNILDLGQAVAFLVGGLAGALYFCWTLTLLG